MRHTCILDDGGTAGRRCQACAHDDAHVTNGRIIFTVSIEFTDKFLPGGSADLLPDGRPDYAFMAQRRVQDAFRVVEGITAVHLSGGGIIHMDDDFKTALVDALPHE